MRLIDVVSFSDGTILMHPYTVPKGGPGFAAPPIIETSINALPAEIGNLVRKTLSESRLESASFDRRRADETMRSLYRARGVRSWAAFCKEAQFCSVAETESGLRVTPQENRGNRGILGRADSAFDVPADADDIRLGKCVIEALRASGRFRIKDEEVDPDD